MVNKLPANSGDAGDLGSIPGSGRSPEEQRATHFSILAWRTPLTEEPGRLKSLGSQRVGHDLVTEYVRPLNQTRLCAFPEILFSIK